MARGGKGGGGRRYVRDAKGRFASTGYSGQTGGRGARLKSGKGNIRQVGGQKRGERHILRSPESKATGKIATAAAAKAGGIIVSRKFGGQGKSINSAEYKAASAVKRAAQAKRDAAELRSGLPKSGGAMRVRGGIKRDPNVAAKLAARNKSTRSSAKPKDGTDITREIGRAKANKRIRNLNEQIKEAGANAGGLRLQKLSVQTRMPNKPRQRRQPTAKQVAKEASRNDAIRKRSAELRAQSARIARAQSNKTRNADVRNGAAPMSKASLARRPSQRTMRSQLRAERALDFYANPAKALREVNKKRPGFRKPRGMR